MPAPKFCHHAAMSTRYRIMWGLVCVVMGIGSPAWAEDGSAGVSEDAFAAFMGTEVLDIEDLADGAEVQREYFNRITPPGVSLFQPMLPPVAPFDEAYFDKDFLAGLLGEYQFSVAMFPLTLVLDPKTRETLIYNAEDDLIATVPGDGVPRTWPEDADPARVTLTLDLLPTEDVEQYLYTEDRVADALDSYASKSAQESKTGGFLMKSLNQGQFGLADFQRLTNGSFRVTVTNGTNGAAVAEVYSYTVVHTCAVVVVGWTNELGVNSPTNILWGPVSPTFNGLVNTWTCRETNLVFTNGIGVWEDADITTNDRVRFYGAAIRTNSDTDNLTDGTEYFVYHTDPEDSDTDDDWVDDGAEVEIGTPPTQSNEVIQVWIQFPENGRQVP